VRERGARRRRLLARAVVPVVAVAAIAMPARAQLGCSGSSCTVEIAVPISDVLRISLSTTGVPLGAPGEADYASGFLDVTGPAVTAIVKANRPFQVQVVGAQAMFGYTGSHPDPAKPASDLLWATTQAGLAGTTNHMGIAGLLMNQGASGNARMPLYLRTLWSFTSDRPGSYSLPIRFTLSAP